MSMTPYNDKQRKISDQVHLNYRDILYSSLFGVKPDAIVYDNLPEKFRSDADGYIACDCCMDVQYRGFPAGFRYLISYRFRDAARFQEKQDVTLTEWNEASNQPGELYKIAVAYFTYGYYAPDGHLVEAVILDVCRHREAIIRDIIHYDKGYNPHNQQPFYAFKFDELKRLGIILRHFKEIDGKLVLIDLPIINTPLPTLTLQQVQDTWDNVKKRVRIRNNSGPRTAAYLNDYTIVSVERGIGVVVVVIQAAHSLHYMYLHENNSYCEDIEWALTMEFDTVCKIRVHPPGAQIIF